MDGGSCGGDVGRRCSASIAVAVATAITAIVVAGALTIEAVVLVVAAAVGGAVAGSRLKLAQLVVTLDLQLPKKWELGIIYPIGT